MSINIGLQNKSSGGNYGFVFKFLILTEFLFLIFEFHVSKQYSWDVSIQASDVVYSDLFFLLYFDKLLEYSRIVTLILWHHDNDNLLTWLTSEFVALCRCCACMNNCTCSIYVKKLSCVQYDIYVRPVLFFFKKKHLFLQKSYEVQYFAILRYRIKKNVILEKSLQKVLVGKFRAKEKKTGQLKRNLRMHKLHYLFCVVLVSSWILRFPDIKNLLSESFE